MVKSQVILGIILIIAGLIQEDFFGRTILIVIGLSLIVFKNEESKIEQIRKVRKK